MKFQKLIFFGVYAASIALAGPSMALTASELAKNCRTPLAQIQASCSAYISGALEMHQNIVRSDKIEPTTCFRLDKKTDQRKIVLDWIKAAKIRQRMGAAQAILLAFAEHFPCPTAPSPKTK